VDDLTPGSPWLDPPFSLGLFGPISYDNNQNRGTVAQFETQNGSVASFGSAKTYFSAVKPC
jgi:hypothetical protein